MADQQLVIQVQAQIGDAQAQLQAVQAQVAGLGATGAAAVAPVQGLGSAFGAFLGGIAVIAVERLASKLVQFGKDAVAAFTKADAAAREFEGVLQERGISIANSLKASTATEKIGGVAGFMPEDIQQAMTNNITKLDSGADAVLGFSVAMDDARIKGISLATAVQSVTIAAEGSLKSLRQFGITTNKDVNGNLLTENQLLKEMAQNMKGGLATYLQTPLGMIDRMKVSVQELKESLGKLVTQGFAPVAAMTYGFSTGLTAALAVVNGGAIPAFNNLAVVGIRVAQVFFNIGMVARTAFDLVGTGIAGIAAALVALVTGGGLSGAKAAMDVMLANMTTLGQDLIDGNKAFNTAANTMSTQTPAQVAAANLKQLQDLLNGIVNDTAGSGTKVAAAWEAAFAPLKLLSGSIPNLAKYVGNLSSSFVLKTELKITIADSTSPSSSKGPSASLPPSVAGAVHAAVQKSLRTATRGVVNQPTSHAAGGFVNFAPFTLGTGFPMGGN